MSRYGRLARFALIGMTIAPLVASADPPSPDIVVRGHEQLTRAQVQHFTRSISASTQDQMARMIEGFCPTVFGMPEHVGQVIADRMKQNAAMLGAPTAKASCKPNVLVIFTEDGQALINSVRKDNPALFGSLGPHDIGKLAASSGPAYLWSNTSIRDEDGTNVSHGKLGQVEAMVERIPEAHIIDLPTLQNIDWTVLVIEQSAAIGKTLTQLADYAAMRTLTQAADVPASAPAADTILALFRTPTPPSALTGFDKSYIGGLYAGRANKSYVAKVSAIARGIDRSEKSQMSSASPNGAPSLTGAAPPGTVN